MDFQELLKKLGSNIDESTGLQKEVSDQMVDRLRMKNPEMQGPPLPETTQQEDQYFDELGGAVAGSVVPVKKLTQPLDVLGLRKMIADVALEGGAHIDDVGRATNQLGREQDFIARKTKATLPTPKLSADRLVRLRKLYSK